MQKHGFVTAHGAAGAHEGPGSRFVRPRSRGNDSVYPCHQKKKRGDGGRVTVSSKKKRGDGDRPGSPGHRVTDRVTESPLASHR